MYEANWISYEELQAMNRAMSFEPLSIEESIKIEKLVMTESGAYAIDRKSCIVTDEWTMCRDKTCLNIEDFPLEAMKSVLCIKRWASVAVQKYYVCSSIDGRLHGILLSNRGFEVSSTGTIKGWFDTKILTHLEEFQNKINRGKRVKIGNLLVLLL